MFLKMFLRTSWQTAGMVVHRIRYRSIEITLPYERTGYTEWSAAKPIDFVVRPSQSGVCHLETPNFTFKMLFITG